MMDPWLQVVLALSSGTRFVTVVRTQKFTGGSMSYRPYEPLNSLKPVAENVWIVDGPVVDMSYMKVFSLPFPTRMTIFRLSGGRLVVHSPTLLSDELKVAVDELGEVVFIISPNRIHYVYLNAWKVAYPRAEIWAAAKVREKVPSVQVDYVFDEDGAPAWDDEMAHISIPGSYMTEVEVFHKPSRTLVLTDLIENFEEDHVDGALMKVAMRCGGVMDPHGSMPKDLRQTFRGKYRRSLRDAVEQMIAWNPERVIVSHGRWYRSEAVQELKRAFGWLLK